MLLSKHIEIKSEDLVTEKLSSGFSVCFQGFSNHSVCDLISTEQALFVLTIASIPSDQSYGVSPLRITKVIRCQI
jgi:hypothetical protein